MAVILMATLASPGLLAASSIGHGSSDRSSGPSAGCQETAARKKFDADKYIAQMNLLAGKKRAGEQATLFPSRMS